MRLFISQPMRGRDQQEILDERDAIFAEVACMAAERGEPCSEVPSYIPSLSGQMGPLYALGAAIQLMADADACAFAPGWEGARGCRVERLCAELYGIPVIEM